jgi:hypothetical protein
MENHAQSITEIFGEPISIYTRAQAIDDGFLIDLSGQFPSDTRIFKYSVACTCGVWALVEKAHAMGQEYGATVWDLCYMAAKSPARKMIDPSTVLFKVSIPLNGKTYTLKMNCGPGDNGAPVMTLMLPDED